MDDHFLDTAITAWRATEMKEELEAGLEKARETVPQLIAEAWSTRSTSPGYRAIKLAWALGQPDLIPPAFTTAMQEMLRGKSDRASWAGRVAELRNEWDALRAATEPLAIERPANYLNRFLLGKALVKLGRKAEAVPHLKAFVDHSPDEPDFLEAQQLLKEAQEP